MLADVTPGSANALDLTPGRVVWASVKATEVSADRPVLVDRFLDDAVEIDVDALYDGTELYLGGVMEHIEEAGIHSGDSSCALPPITLGHETIDRIRRGEDRRQNLVLLDDLCDLMTDGSLCAMGGLTPLLRKVGLGRLHLLHRLDDPALGRAGRQVLDVGGVVPALRDPCAVVQHAQRAQGLDQRSLMLIEVGELLVTLDDVVQLGAQRVQQVAVRDDVDVLAVVGQVLGCVGSGDHRSFRRLRWEVDRTIPHRIHGRRCEG